MDNEKLSQLKKEFIILAGLTILFIVMLRIIFYKESISNVAKFVLSIFWLFILPGYSIMFYWHKELSFLERLTISFVLGAGLLGATSFYLGLLGLHTKYHGIIIPVVIILLSAKFIIYSLRFNNDGS